MTRSPVEANIGVILLNFIGFVFYFVGKLSHRSVHLSRRFQEKLTGYWHTIFR